MSYLPTLPPSVVLAILLAGPTSRAEEQPHLLPTRDVDITYDATRPPQTKKIDERARSDSPCTNPSRPSLDDQVSASGLTKRSGVSPVRCSRNPASANCKATRFRVAFC
jgi:hypothetical protein